LRTTIYKSYIENPASNDLHALSTRYGISVKRVEAILRLKSLEAGWKKTDLQTGFLAGMESILGIRMGGRQLSVPEEINSPGRDDVREADEIAGRLAGEGGQRGLNRTFFEPVDEGEEAVVPRLLSEARQRAAAARAAERPEYPSHVVQPDPLRPAYRFVDVGLRWFDAKDAARRVKESSRRKGVKARRNAAKEAARAEAIAATAAAAVVVA